MWHGHLQIATFIAKTPSLGPREAQVRNQMFSGALRDNLLHFFCSDAFEGAFYSWKFYLVYWAKLVKRLQSGRCYAGIAALGPKEPHKGNWVWLRALRRGCVRFVLLLTSNSPASMPGRWPCGSFARKVGTCKSGRYYTGALCQCPP